MFRQALAPATPTIADMLGARISYVHARPYRCENIIATGTITAVEEDKNGILHFRVQPDAAHLLPKWRSELDLLHYLPVQINGGIEKVATAAA